MSPQHVPVQTPPTLSDVTERVLVWVLTPRPKAIDLVDKLNLE